MTVPSLEEEIRAILDAMDAPMEEFIAIRNGLERGSDSPFPEEEVKFVEWLSRRRPRRVVELGTGRGGFSTDIIRCLAPDARMFCIEITKPDSLRIDLWLAGLARWDQEIKFQQGDSRSEEMKAAALEFLGEPPDFVFIDTDHSFETTQKEFDLYWPSIVPGGAIGFHDIYSALDGVYQVWRKLRSEAREYEEFVNHGSYAECLAVGGSCYGIGVAVK